MDGLTDKMSLSHIVNLLVESMSPNDKASARMLFVIKNKRGSQDSRPQENSSNLDRTGALIENSIIRKLQASMFYSIQVKKGSWGGQPTYEVLINDSTEHMHNKINKNKDTE